MTASTPDEAAATVERLTQRPKGGVVWSPKELADRSLAAGYREACAERDSLRARLAAQQPVIDAAEEYVEIGGKWSHNELVRAVDAYRAASGSVEADTPAEPGPDPQPVNEGLLDRLRAYDVSREEAGTPAEPARARVVASPDTHDVYVRKLNVMRGTVRTEVVKPAGIMIDWWTDAAGVEHVAGVEVLTARGVEVDGIDVVKGRPHGTGPEVAGTPAAEPAPDELPHPWLTDEATARMRARPCKSCGHPFSPTHDVDAPGPTARHPFAPTPKRRATDG